MRVLLVDDEPPARKKLRRLLEPHHDVIVVGEAGSGEEAVRALDGTAKLDLVFLDVQMPDMDGFEVLRRLEGPLAFRPVFVTAYDTFAVRAFDVNALDYLVKPVDPRRFGAMLARARDALRIEPPSDFPSRFLVTEKDRAYFVPTSGIDWIESDRNYVVIHEGGREHIVRGTLEAFVKSLDPKAFARISRSHVVHLEAVRELKPSAHGERIVSLRDGASLVWTRRYRTD